jgi:hypothetical protein
MIVERHGWDNKIFVEWMHRLRKPWRHAAKVRDLAVDLGISVDALPRVPGRTRTAMQRAVPLAFLLGAALGLLPFVPVSVPCTIAIASYEGLINVSKYARRVLRFAAPHASARLAGAMSCVYSGVTRTG